MCIKLVNYWDKYTEMHGQQNVKIGDNQFVAPAALLLIPQKTEDGQTEWFCGAC